MSKYSLASCFSYESASTKVTLALLKSFYFQTAHHGNCQMQRRPNDFFYLLACYARHDAFFPNLMSSILGNLPGFLLYGLALVIGIDFWVQ